MKKLLTIATLSVMLCACSSDDGTLKFESGQDQKTVISIRTPEEAIAVAGQFAALNSKSNSRSESKTVDASSLKILGSTSSSRSQADTLIYAVDFADNEGFILISANKSTEPILAFIDEGNYDESASVENEGYKYFEEAAKDYVAGAPSRLPLNPGPEDYRLIEYVDSITVYNSSGSRVQVKWDQYWPQNMFCPNKIAGCGPLAITMVMTYIKPATSLSLTFPERPYDHLDIDWAEIVKHNKSLGIKNPTDIEIASHYNNCGASDDVHVKLGALIREIGYRGNCFYEDNGTGMWTSDAKMMLDQMIPGQDGEYAQPSQFYDKLSSKGVGFVYGSAGTSAHFWVADGVANITHVITRYYNYNPKTKECDYSEGETRV